MFRTWNDSYKCNSKQRASASVLVLSFINYKYSYKIRKAITIEKGTI